VPRLLPKGLLLNQTNGQGGWVGIYFVGARISAEEGKFSIKKKRPGDVLRRRGA
jgi:hypothetical protein